MGEGFESGGKGIGVGQGRITDRANWAGGQGLLVVNSRIVYVTLICIMQFINELYLGS